MFNIAREGGNLFDKKKQSIKVLLLLPLYLVSILINVDDK